MATGSVSSHQTSCLLAKSSNIDFVPIRKPKIFEEVAQRLQDLVAREFRPGDTIPPERELTRLFGVSRSSVREAVRTLAGAGLLQPRQGSGTIVCGMPAPTPRFASREPLTRRRKQPMNVMDARLAIEPMLARHAALHASSKDIRKLEQILSQQQRSVEQGQTCPDEDLQFHYAIALAAKNDVMVKVADVLIEVIRRSRRCRPRADRHELEAHRQIFAALVRRDSAAAEHAMRRHLQEIETRYS